MNLGMVDIVKEYLEAHRAVSRVIDAYRSGAPAFDAVQELIWNGENSVLFRLKERCHERFRVEDEAQSLPAQREVLFDLAVGALFLETMKFREALYQEAVFGPRIRRLQSEEELAEDPIFAEFEKIVAGASILCEESLAEIEALLERTREQLCRLLSNYGEDGLVARHLIEKRPLLDQVYTEGLETLFEQIYGSVGKGYGVAARSYLESGFFTEAQLAFEEALDRDPLLAAEKPLISYCRGMSAFLTGEFEEALSGLWRWCEGGIDSSLEACSEEARLRTIKLAIAAVKSIEHQAKDAGADELSARARGILDEFELATH